MSFSKARLRRFNEEISDVPSPGRYDPKVDSTVKGVVMPSSKRFPGQATSSSLDNIEKATSSAVVFRTPQLPRKVPLTPRLQYLKDKNFDTSGSDILSSEEKSCVKSTLKKTVSKADYKRLENELHSLTDKFHNQQILYESEVNELKSKIDEIKNEEMKLKEILEKKSKLASDRHNETLQLKENLDVMIEKLNINKEEHQRYINELKLKISELENKKYELETVLAEKQSVIVAINDKYTDLEHELKSLQEENLILEQANTCILMGADERLQQLENSLSNKLQSFRESLEARYEKEQMSSQSKINYFEHEFNLITKEKINQLKESQEKVKELGRLTDKKVREFSKDIKEADERCKYLFRELCKVEGQRDDLVASDLEKKLALIDIEKKSESYLSELEECKKTCRKYQITMNTMNQTITALSTRLFESENEVERLNVVEKDLERQKQALELKSQLLFANVQALGESLNKIEEETIRDINTFKTFLEAKVDLFKNEALKTEESLNNQIHEKKCAIDLLLKENEYFKKEVERKDVMIEEIKSKEKNYEEKIKRMNFEQSELKEEFSETLNAQKNLYMILNTKLKNANTLIDDLQHLRSQHESKITSLSKEVEELKAASSTLESSKLELTSRIQSLQTDLERNKEVETKQKQHIDNLISDLVLEKERCEALETEKVRINALLHDAELTVAEKTEETKKLQCCLESVQQKLKSCEEKVSLLEGEKVMTHEKLIAAENMVEKLKSDSHSHIESQRKIEELQSQLYSAKEKIKTEIPKLERDNINKAENILELNLNIDSLKEELELKKTEISCLEAEKTSLHNVMDEMKSNICNLKIVIEERNLSISALNEEIVRREEFCNNLLSQIDEMSSDRDKLNEEIKSNSEISVKLLEAEDKIFDLEMQLCEKDKELDVLKIRINEVQFEDAHRLKEELDDLKVKYAVLVEDRDKLSHEVGELMGHQNTLQKIKKVSELKQYNTDLKKEVEFLRLENLKLKNKLQNTKEQTDNKENITLTRREDKQKVSKPGSTKKKPMSPNVLKPSNF